MQPDETQGGNAAKRQDVFVRLADRYLNMEPSDRYEVVSEVLAGERCEHGYPDQGEGCEVCDVR